MVMARRSGDATGCFRAPPGRCSCVTRARSPARPMLRAVPGVTQASPPVPAIPAAGAALCAMAPMAAGHRSGCASPGTIVRRRTRPSACCQIVWPVTFRGRSTRSSRSWPRSRPRAVWKRRPTSCGPTSRSPSAVRWVRRRLRPIRLALLTVITLLPDRFPGDARLAAVRAALATSSALRALRTDAAPHLATLPTPLGFHPRAVRRDARPSASPHGMGADRAGPPR